jgi:hypothetical protein
MLSLSTEARKALAYEFDSYPLIPEKNKSPLLLNFKAREYLSPELDMAKFVLWTTLTMSNVS